MAIIHESQQGTSAVAAETETSTFCWYELHTPDVAAAETFYKPVLGWETQSAGMADRKYVLVSAGGVPVGGLLEKPAGKVPSGETSRWIGYIGVKDVAGSSDNLVEAGGALLRPAENIPGVGTFAVVADPQGAPFVLFQAPEGIVAPEPPGTCTPGAPVWRELAAIDREAAFRFYAGLFGWTKAQLVDMGPNGAYQLFAAGGDAIGGMMTRGDASQTAHWQFYFHVEDLKAAMDRVIQHGGRVVNGPVPVPGGAQIANCLDTSGALFGIVGPGNK